MYVIAKLWQFDGKIVFDLEMCINWFSQKRFKLCRVSIKKYPLWEIIINLENYNYFK